jgi:hypothetical protein
MLSTLKPAKPECFIKVSRQLIGAQYRPTPFQTQNVSDRIRACLNLNSS